MTYKQQILQSEPIKIGDRTVTLEAKMTWGRQRRATFGLQNNSGYGWAWVRLQPTAVIEQWADRKRRIAIRDQTGQLLMGLLAGALLVPFLMQVAVRLARPKKAE